MGRIPGVASPTVLPRWLAAGRQRRFMVTMAVVLTVLVVTNVLHKFGPAGSGVVLGPLVAIALVLLARRFGLSWDDLGLARHTWLRGLAIAASAVAAVTVLYGVAAILPLTRSAFLDARYQLAAGPALVTALVVIPLGTVLVEEIAFRGVLLGLVSRHRSIGWGLGFSSALFGAWHILPSLGLGQDNPAIARLTGTGAVAQVAVVLAVVAFTAVAGVLLCELRRRTGSLLAAAGLHWATNGVGVLFAAAMYATGAG